MSTPEQTTGRRTIAFPAPTPAPSWFGGPATRALALTLLVANLVVMGVMFQHQSDALDRLESLVIGHSSEGTAPVSADPELCWLLGAVAYNEGHSEQFKAMLSGDAGTTPCGIDALRGAAGVNR